MKPKCLFALIFVSFATGFCSPNSKEVAGKYVGNVYYAGEFADTQLSEENVDNILAQKNRIGRFSVGSAAVEFGVKLMKEYEEYATRLVFGRNSELQLRFTRHNRVFVVTDPDGKKCWIFVRKEGFDADSIEAIRAALIPANN
jgi:hypothetical protein